MLINLPRAASCRRAIKTKNHREKCRGSTSCRCQEIQGVSQEITSHVINSTSTVCSGSLSNAQHFSASFFFDFDLYFVYCILTWSLYACPDLQKPFHLLSSKTKNQFRREDASMSTTTSKHIVRNTIMFYFT